MGALMGYFLVKHAGKITLKTGRFVGKTCLQAVELIGQAATGRSLTTAAEGAIKAAEETAVAAISRLGEKVASTAIGELVERSVAKAAEYLSETMVAKLASKLSTMGAAAEVPVAGWVIDAIMLGSLAVDLMDPSGYGQYLDNQLGVMTQRNALEGYYIQDKKQEYGNNKTKRNGNPPYLFTLDNITMFMPEKPTDSASLASWNIIDKIGKAYKVAHDHYINDSIEKGLGEMSEEHLSVVAEFFMGVIEETAGINSDYGNVHLPEDIMDQMTKYVGYDVKERDAAIYDYMKNGTINIILKNESSSDTEVYLFNWDKDGSKYIKYG